MLSEQFESLPCEVDDDASDSSIGSTINKRSFGDENAWVCFLIQGEKIKSCFQIDFPRYSPKETFK
jgi:hypothetical protein